MVDEGSISTNSEPVSLDSRQWAGAFHSSVLGKIFPSTPMRDVCQLIAKIQKSTLPTTAYIWNLYCKLTHPPKERQPDRESKTKRRLSRRDPTRPKQKKQMIFSQNRNNEVYAYLPTYDHVSNPQRTSTKRKLPAVDHAPSKKVTSLFPYINKNRLGSPQPVTLQQKPPLPRRNQPAQTANPRSSILECWGRLLHPPMKPLCPPPSLVKHQENVSPLSLPYNNPGSVRNYIQHQNKQRQLSSNNRKVAIEKQDGIELQRKRRKDYLANERQQEIYAMRRLLRPRPPSTVIQSYPPISSRPASPKLPPHSPQYEDPHHSPQEDSPANNYLQETVVSNAVTHHSVPNLSPTLSAEAKVALVEHFANSDRIRVAGNGQCLISAINTSRARLLLPILDPDHTRQLICDFYRFNAIGQAHIQRSDLNITTVTKAILEEWLDDTALYALTHLLNCSFTVYHILHQNTVCDGISISEISSTIPHPAPTSAPPHRINLLLKNSNHYDGLLDRGELLTPTSTISTSQLTKTSHQTCPLPIPKKLKLTDYFPSTEKPHHDLFCSKPKTSQAKSASRNKLAPPRKHHSQSQSIKRQIGHEDTHLVHPPNERPTCVSKLARSLHHTQPLHTHNQPDPTELPISEQFPASPISRTLYRPQGTPHEHPSRKRARDVSPHKPGGIT